MIEPPPRIVSLIPSGTEILCALGFGDQLVGRSHECDFPEFVRDLPACCEPTIDIAANSREIDRQVKNTLAAALSIYRVHTDRLRELAPTHLLTQAQCDVCAVSFNELQETVCELLPSQPRILDTSPMTLVDVLESIEQLAEQLGAAERGWELRNALEERLKRIRSSALSGPRPRVLCLEWLDPPMSAGNWMPELVELAGGDPLLCAAGKHSPWLTWEAVRSADPDVIVLLPCGFDILRTRQELAAIEDHEDWLQLRAVRERRTYIADGNQFFNRPGPRLVESAEILQEIFQDASAARPTRKHPRNHWQNSDLFSGDGETSTNAIPTGL